MDRETWQRIERIFLEAVEQAPRARDEFLAVAWSGRPEVEREVRALLAAHDGAFRLRLEQRLDAMGLADVEEPAGRQIGAYRLLRFIARGGMGDVYLAEREQPYRQTVALKLLRPGMVTDEAITRFRQERQILARLTHPNITQILDGGVHGGERPYLVLQFVDGRPITEYCDAHRLPRHGRLRLFLTVCAAVGYAHRHLVIHRDLKPSNILVTDGGEVRLLDFGIAKLIDPPALDAEAVVTRDYRPMTLEHAAPEQIRGDAITTATDVYALGVLLHELLAGRKPFPGAGVTRAELERRVCEDRPALPIAGDPDLDNIVLVALRKEPERRYVSVEQLALDVERYLAHQPVSARPDTLRYRSGKFVRRHIATVAAGAIALGVLLAFTILTVLQSHELERERDAARGERHRADQVVRLLTDLFEASNPEKEPGGTDLRVSDFLDRGERLMFSGLGSQPDLQARMKLVLAEVHRARSEFPRARRLADEALQEFQRLDGPDSASALEAFRATARLTMLMDGPPAAVASLRESLDRHRRLYPPGDARVALAMEDLARALPSSEERLRLLEDALQIRRRARPEVPADIAANLTLQAIYHLDATDLDRAEALFDEARAVYRRVYADTHPRVLDVLNSLGAVYLYQYRLDLAERTFREQVEVRSAVAGPESFEVADSLNGLAVTLARQGRRSEAEAVFRRSIDLASRILGPGHWQVANDQRNLAVVLQQQGRLAEAVSVMQEAYEKFNAAPDRVDGVHFMRAQLGYMWTRTGRVSDGLAALQKSLDGLTALHPGGHEYVADTQVLLGQALLWTGAAGEAEPLLREAVAFRRTRLPPGHAMIAEAECGLAVALVRAGRQAEAAPLFARSLPAYTQWGFADMAEVARARDVAAAISRAGVLDAPRLPF